MSSLALRTVKQKHVKFIEKMIRKETKTDIPNQEVLSYLETTRKVLKDELDDEKTVMYEYDEKTYEKLKRFFTQDEDAMVLAYLLGSEYLTVRMLVDRINIERTRIYRILDRLIEKNIVGKTNTPVIRYYIIDKENPFKSIIQHRLKELESLQSFNIITCGE